MHRSANDQNQSPPATVSAGAVEPFPRALWAPECGRPKSHVNDMTKLGDHSDRTLFWKITGGNKPKLTEQQRWVPR